MVWLIQAGIQIAVRIRRIYQIGIVGKDTHPWRIRTLIRIIFIGHISQFVGIPSGRLIRHIVCHRIANVCDLAAITAFEGCSFRVRESPIDIWHNSVVRAERAYVSDIIEIEVSIFYFVLVVYGRILYIPIECSAEFRTAIYSNSARILIQCRQIAAQCAKRSGHRHETRRTFQISLRN